MNVFVRRALSAALLVPLFVAACGGTSEREIPVCRNAWREVSIPEEYRGFHAAEALWIDGRLYLLRGESHPAPPPPGPKGLVFDLPAQFAPISDEAAPTFILLVAAVALGSNILVFSDNAGDGGRYDTVTDTWTALSPVGLDYSSQRAGVALPEKGVLVGLGVGTLDALRVQYLMYEGADDAWREVASPLQEPDSGWVGVWTGEDVVAGGVTSTGNEQAWLGARYSASADQWSAVTSPEGESTVLWFPVAWTGAEVIAAGQDGIGGSHVARYYPDRDSWEPASMAGQPKGFPYHAVPIGRTVLFWNATEGETATSFGIDSGLYDAETDMWSDVPMRCGPESRYNPTVTWADRGLVVWGGSCFDEPLDACPERAWYLPAEALFGELPDDPAECSCPAPLGGE